MLIAGAAFAQSDSVIYTKDYIFDDGIYLSFEQFRNNKPIPKSSIIHSNRGINAPDYFFQLFSASSVSYTDSSGKELKVDLEDIWGYCHDRSVFIGTRDASRLAVIGSLSHFSKVVTHEGPTMYGIAGPVYSPPTHDIDQFVLDMRAGKVSSFTVSGLLELFRQRDAELYNEYSSLRKRKKKEMRFIYLKKYNEHHPLYVPASF